MNCFYYICRGFDPRRLHQANGVVTSFRVILEAGNWSLLGYTGTVYGNIKGSIKEYAAKFNNSFSRLVRSRLHHPTKSNGCSMVNLRRLPNPAQYHKGFALLIYGDIEL